MELSISFSIIGCSCGAARQAEQPCDVCGCEPDEVDEDLERRRQIVAALNHRAAAPQEPDGLSVVTLWTELGAWLESFTQAFERTNEGHVDEAAARLQHSIDGLHSLRGRVAAAPKRRPHLADWRAAERILEINVRLIDRCTRALVAPTPAAAEVEATDLQAALDEAAAIIHRFNAVSDERSALDEVELSDEYGDIVAGARSAFTLAGAKNLVEFEGRGAALYERITGRRDCPVGFGIRLQMLNLVVESSFDEDRCWTSAGTIYRVLIDSGQAFERLVQDHQWRRDFVEVSREAREAGIEASAIGAAGANRRRDLRSGIRCGAITTERLAPSLVATLLTVKRRSAYARERGKEIRTLLEEGRAAGFGDLLKGIDLALRDADAHQEFEIKEDGVEFTSKRREYDFLSDDELIDRVLMGFESVCALQLGIVAALPAAGVEQEELEELMADKLEPDEMARVMMAMNGWDEIEVERAGNTLRIRGTRTVETPTGVAASLLPTLDADVEHLILEGDGIGRRRVARGPVAPFRCGAETIDPAEKHAASLEALATWTIDGKPPIARSALRKVVAVTTLQALLPETPQDEALATLRALAGLTHRLTAHGLLKCGPDRRLDEAVAAALELRQQVATGGPSRERLQQVVDALVRLAPDNVPDLRATW